MGLFSSQISTKKMVPLCRQLAQAYDAGLPIVRTLQIVGEQQRDRKTREMLGEVRHDIEQGATLAQAWGRHTKRVPQVFQSLIATGEQGGRLDLILKDLADYYEDRMYMGNKIKRALTYPMLQIVAAWFLGTFALRIVSKLPNIVSARGERFSFESFLTDYAIFQAISMTCFIGILLVFAALNRLGTVRFFWSQFLTRIWPLSRVTRKFALARFFRSLSLMLGSGLDVMQAINLSADAVSNPYIARDLKQAIPLVRQGQSLYESFLPCRYLTRTAREMIRVGEEAGKLEEALRKVSQYHLEEATHSTQVATKILGVLVVLAVACLIGWIVISFWTGFYGGMMNELGI